MESIPFKVENGQIVFNETSLAFFVKKYEGKSGDCVIRKSRRTSRQNRALYLYFQLIADALNNGGLTVKKVLAKKTIEIDWNTELVKELLWRPVQMILYNIKSTKNLSKQKEIDTIFEHLTRHLGEKFGIEHIPFPHFETEEEFIKSTLN